MHLRTYLFYSTRIHRLFYTGMVVFLQQGQNFAWEDAAGVKTKEFVPTDQSEAYCVVTSHQCVSIEDNKKSDGMDWFFWYHAPL